MFLYHSNFPFHETYFYSWVELEGSTQFWEVGFQKWAHDGFIVISWVDSSFGISFVFASHGIISRWYRRDLWRVWCEWGAVHISFARFRYFALALGFNSWLIPSLYVQVILFPVHTGHVSLSACVGVQFHVNQVYVLRFNYLSCYRKKV